MNYQVLPYFLSLLVIFFLFLSLAIYTVSQKVLRSSRAFATLLSISSFWALGYMLLGTRAKSIGSVLIYVSMALIPAIWLFFTVRFTGFHLFDNLFSRILLAVPSLALIVAYLAHLQELNHAVEEAALNGLVPLTGSGFAGIWFFVTSLYANITLLASALALLRFYPTSDLMRRGQAHVLITAMAFPWFASLLSWLQIYPWGQDTVLYSIIGSGITILWGHVRYRMLEIMPLAHRAMIERMEDGMIVLDRQQRMIYLNQSAREIFKLPLRQKLGKIAVEQVFPQAVNLIQLALNEGQTQFDLSIGDGNHKHYFDVHIVILSEQKNLSEGAAITLHNITERKWMEQMLRVRISTERLVSKISNRFINLSAGEIGGEIESALENICQHTGASRAFVFLLDPFTEDIQAYYEWFPPEFSAADRNRLGGSLNAYKWSTEILKDGRTIRINDIETDLPPQADTEKTLWSAVGMNALLAVPLALRGANLGILGISKDSPCRWEEEYVRLLRLVSEFLVIALERKNAQEALAESEGRYQMIFSSMAEGVIVMSKRGYLLFCNNSAARLLDVNEEEISGQVPYQKKFPVLNEDGSIMSDENHPGLSTLRSGVALLGIIMGVYNREEKLSWVIVNTQPLITARETKPHAVVITFSDITERLEAENALKRRDAILEVISLSAERFLKTPDWEAYIRDVLASLGNVSGASRIYVTRVHTRSDGQRAGTEWCTWTSPDIPPEIQQPSWQDVSLSEIGFARWEKLLAGNQVVYELTENLPSGERDFMEQRGIQSVIQVPIFVSGNWWGYIGFDAISRQPNWMHTDVEALKTAANILGAAIQRQSVEQSLQRYAERIQGLRCIDQAILTADTPQQIITEALEQLQDLIPCDQSSVLFYDRPNDKIWALPYSRQSGAGVLHNLRSLQSSDIPPELLKGNIVSMPDLRTHPRTARLERVLLRMGVVSYFSVPLMGSNQVVGMLSCSYEVANGYTQEHMEIAREVADILAVGIQSAQLQIETNEALRRESHLNEIVRAISSTLDLDVILKDVVRLAVGLLGMESGKICLLSDAETLVSCHLYNLPEETLHPDQPFRENIGAKAILHKRATLHNQYSSHKLADPRLVDLGIRGCMCVPLVSSGKVLGLLSLFNRDADHKIQERDLELAGLVARQGSIAVQNALLFQKERHRAKEMEAFSGIITDTLAELEIDRVLQTIVEQAISLLNASAGEIALYNEERKDMRVVVSIGLDRDYTGTVLSPGEGAMGMVALTRQPLLVEDYIHWGGRSAQYQNACFNGFLIPLMAADRMLGVFGAGDTYPGRKFGKKEKDLLILFAQQASIAINNAMLFEAATERAAEAETLRQASSVVTSSLNLNEIIELILEQLEWVVPYDSAAVLLLKDDQLEIVGGHGFDDIKRVVGLQFPIDENNPNAEVYRRCAPVILSNAGERYEAFKEPPHDHIRSWMGIPLIFHEHFTGMITLDSSQFNYFTREHQQMAVAFADQVAVAMENARLFEKVQRSAAEAETLREAAAAVAASLQLDEIIHRILEQLEKVVPYDSASVQLCKGKFLEIVGGRGFPDLKSVLGVRFPLEGNNPQTQISLSHQPLIMDNAMEAFPSFSETLHLNIVSWMGIPLLLQNQFTGLLALDKAKKGYFTEEHVRLVSAFADQVAIALENARLFEEVNRLAIFDPLTDVFNRRHFFQMAEMELERAYRYGRDMAIIMLDLDEFKKVNDTYGHSIGDQVLQSVARRCRINLRDTDIIGRYGGEEFVILLPETDTQKALEAAERLRQRVSGEAVITVRGPVQVTISQGVVALAGEFNLSLDALLDRADQMLYQSKTSGRNCVSVWNRKILN